MRAGHDWPASTALRTTRHGPEVAAKVLDVPENFGEEAPVDEAHVQVAERGAQNRPLRDAPLLLQPKTRQRDLGQEARENQRPRRALQSLSETHYLVLKDVSLNPRQNLVSF
eukprot:scaffold2963_cov250-Pinguiococcus_pyrenoidosus.AAC.17